MAERKYENQEEMDEIKKVLNKSFSALQFGFMESLKILAEDGCPPDVAKRLIGEMTQMILEDTYGALNEAIIENEKWEEENIPDKGLLN